MSSNCNAMTHGLSVDMGAWREMYGLNIGIEKLVRLPSEFNCRPLHHARVDDLPSSSSITHTEAVVSSFSAGWYVTASTVSFTRWNAFVPFK